ncbi:Cd(II)/Pb(II)-responsive transcriptional regulator, partial [Halomonas sp. BBD48]|nr:Cd(II)/Pb(II)-responsive transcriptional regulator [Halomonas sp. BBD48]
ERDCAAVNALIDEHIGHVETRLAQLSSLRDALLDLRARCRDEAETGTCGILRELALPAEEQDSGELPPPVQHIGGSHSQ